MKKNQNEQVFEGPLMENIDCDLDVTNSLKVLPNDNKNTFLYLRGYMERPRINVCSCYQGDTEILKEMLLTILSKNLFLRTPIIDAVSEFLYTQNTNLNENTKIEITLSCHGVEFIIGINKFTITQKDAYTIFKLLKSIRHHFDSRILAHKN